MQPLQLLGDPHWGDHGHLQASPCRVRPGAAQGRGCSPCSLRSTLSPCSFPRSAFRKAISASPLFHRLQGKKQNTPLSPRLSPSHPEPLPQGMGGSRSALSAHQKGTKEKSKKSLQSTTPQPAGLQRRLREQEAKQPKRKNKKELREGPGTRQEQAVTAPRLREEPRTHGRLRTDSKPFVCSSN